MFDFIMKGGVLMYPILLCSVIAIAIILERLFHFSRAGVDLDDFTMRIKNSLKEGDITVARTIAANTHGPVGEVTQLVLEDNFKGRKSQEKRIEITGSREIRKLESNLRGLSIIANITPLLGLLGTVTGMIRAFMKIQELGGRVDAVVLAGGIWEAMITTGAGLAVAIPSMVAYHLFEGRVDSIAAGMKDVVSEIGELLGINEVNDFVEESKMLAIKEEEGYGI